MKSALRWFYLGFLLSGPLAASAGPIRVGASGVSIQPPAGIGLAGYYHERQHAGVLDDLMAKAFVLDDGTTRVAIVVCDLISMPAAIAREARQRVEQHSGIPAAHVMIAATHTHTAPVLFRESSRDETDGGGKPVARDYSRRVAERIAEAVAAADARKQVVRLAVATELEPSLAHNRRFWMRDGTVGWNPGKGNTNIVRPAGPIDPEVGVLQAESITNRDAVVFTFVNYAMHPDTTGGSRLSADYPGALARILGMARGNDMLTMFANGTCGNINHIDVRWPAPQKGVPEATRLGAALAAAVLKASARAQVLTNPGLLRVRSERVQLPPAPYTAEQLERARMDVRTATDKTRDGFMRMVRAHRVLDTLAREGRPWEVEMQVIALGQQVAWVAWPGEIFVELGLSVKAKSPFPQTYNIELANGTIGYIPNQPAYAEGNYEVESARVAEGSGELLVQSALRLLAELHQAAAGSR